MKLIFRCKFENHYEGKCWEKQKKKRIIKIWIIHKGEKGKERKKGFREMEGKAVGQSYLMDEFSLCEECEKIN